MDQETKVKKKKKARKQDWCEKALLKYFQGRRLIIIHSIYHTACCTIGCLCALRCHSFKKPGSVFPNTGSASERDSPHLHLSVIYHQEVSTRLTKERIQVLFLTQNWASSAAPKIIRSNVRSHLQTSLQHTLSVLSTYCSTTSPRRWGASQTSLSFSPLLGSYTQHHLPLITFLRVQCFQHRIHQLVTSLQKMRLVLKIILIFGSLGSAA